MVKFRCFSMFPNPAWVEYESSCYIHQEEAEKYFVRDRRTPHLKRFSTKKIENAVQIQKQLAENKNIHVSHETVRNTLRAAGLKGHAKVKKPVLTKIHQQIRLGFAKKICFVDSRELGMG